MTTAQLVRKAPVMPRKACVINLAEVDAKMLPIVGGKAANLGELIRAGFPVPPGFCVTTEAYAEVASAASLDYDAFESAATGQLERLASGARNALLHVPIPAAIQQAIIESYQLLGDQPPVAVRSSATAEDLPTASFAGQQDTYLNIVGAGSVIDAVQRCWASLWTHRAVVYRAINNIDPRAVRLAVVVQRMVDAQVAGVLFTANPVTGRRRQAVIDASPGLGEAVVSGSVNPDHFVVDTPSGTILERRIGDKRFEVLSLAGGGTRQVVKPESENRQCITDAQARDLAKLGDRVEAHYRSPQDTEWAIDEHDTIWLTQARPITTLYPLPPRANPNPEDLRVYLCFTVAQGLYRALTPSGLVAFRLIASGAARLLGIHVEQPLDGPPVYAEAGQRVFVDLTSTLRGRIGRALFPGWLGVMEARSAAVLPALLEDPRLSVNHRSPFLFIRRVLRLALRYGVPLQVMRAILCPDAAIERVDRYGAQLARRLTAPSNATPHERLEFIECTLSTEICILFPGVMPAAAAGMGSIALVSTLLGDDLKPGELDTVLRALPHNVTTEMDLELWQLSSQIRQDSACAQVLREKSPAELSALFQQASLPEPAQSGIANFLSTWGHRGVAEIDIGMPRWSDDPTYIFGVLANYLRLDKPEQAPDAMFARGAAEAEKMAESLADRARQRGWLKGKLVRWALSRARKLMGLRETPKFYAVVVLAAARRELSRIGAELAQRGRIDAADDVFFLDFRDVRAAIDGTDMRARVEERRQAYQTELRRRHVPNVLLSDGTAPQASRSLVIDAKALSGTPASAGSVTGVARVILDPVGAHIEPGEILVAPSTDPGWTPLFLTAGGLVMEMGGANSHGAVVAREYGIPAVVGVPDATSRIASGQRIRVDGSAGTIELLS